MKQVNERFASHFQLQFWIVVTRTQVITFTGFYKHIPQVNQYFRIISLFKDGKWNEEKKHTVFLARGNTRPSCTGFCAVLETSYNHGKGGGQGVLRVFTAGIPSETSTIENFPLWRLAGSLTSCWGLFQHVIKSHYSWCHDRKCNSCHYQLIGYGQ